MLIALVFSLAITNTVTIAASSNSSGNPSFKSPMNNYVPGYITLDPGKSLYDITYTYNVSGVSNAK